MADADVLYIVLLLLLGCVWTLFACKNNKLVAVSSVMFPAGCRTFPRLVISLRVYYCHSTRPPCTPLK
jgi:ABC-type arginine transport system permease subunit